MLYNQISIHDRYDLRSPRFQESFRFLARTDLGTLPEGTYPVCPGVTAYVQLYNTSPAEELDLETHRNYFDIQYVVSGEEGVGVIPLAGLKEKTQYNPDRDIQYWQEPEHTGMVVLRPGEYVVLPPDMAHKPRCTLKENCAVRKIVIKVPAEPRN
ncbi:MAG: YhcH/YjgK/YiaL family protein [Oscillospiraceae bacterium]|nr:YhcH/YjgK/YiaL family protein [Oscillospiraceae bacterium]